MKKTDREAIAAFLADRGATKLPPDPNIAPPSNRFPVARGVDRLRGETNAAQWIDGGLSVRVRPDGEAHDEGWGMRVVDYP